MELSGYVESIRRDLAATAEVAGEDARAAAERLTSALDPAVRLALIDALSEAASEITRELAPGSVEVRMRAREPEFVVTKPPAGTASGDPEIAFAERFIDRFLPPPPPAPPGPPGPPGEEPGTARMTLRMPEPLKTQVEAAATAEGISVNAWLVRVIGAAVADPRGRSGQGQPGTRHSRNRGPGQQFSGWVR